MASSPTQPRAKKSSVTLEPPKLDLETYIANYEGRTRFERLFLIGTTSAYLGEDALRLAVREAKSGKDTNRYDQAVAQLKVLSPQDPEATRDTEWAKIQSKAYTTNLNRLEKELDGYKNNQIRESMRLGYEDIGNHYYSAGYLPKAFEAYGRMRQEVVNVDHLLEIGRHLVEVAIEQRNWVSVLASVGKMRGALVNAEATNPKFAWAQPFCEANEGLARLDSGDFFQAALHFLRIESGMGTTSNTIIAPNDVATYGGLCALATMNRNELNAKVLENSTFRTYLELEPHIRRAISFFVNSRYTACLAILESYRSDYLLDIHLHKHFDNIYQMVRSKSIVQYFIPFSCVTLDSLNKAFAAPGKSIEKELATMIQTKVLDARIDTQNKLLTSVPSSPRSTLHLEALKTAKNYERDARRRLLHVNIVNADLELKSSKSAAAALAFGDDFGEGVLGRNLRNRQFSQDG